MRSAFRRPRASWEAEMARRSKSSSSWMLRRVGRRGGVECGSRLGARSWVCGVVMLSGRFSVLSMAARCGGRLSSRRWAVTCSVSSLYSSRSETMKAEPRSGKRSWI